MQIQSVTVMTLVNDIERALKFYRDILGFTVQEEQEDLVLFAEGVGLQLSLEPLPELNLSLNAVMLTLFIPDVHAAFHELTERGAAFFLAPTTEGGVTFASLRDTEGNLIQLFETGGLLSP